MRKRIRLLLALLLIGAGAAQAGEPRHVALTVSLPANADSTQADLAKTLLALLEMEAGRYEHIAIVERMQIDLALNELVLNRSLAAAPESQLQLGRLATADLILTMQIREPRDDEKSPRVLVRIVDAQTGAIRGATAAPLDETMLDDVALQIARYLAAVVEAPQQAGLTIAVGPFDSAGRFDRLRPLELGIRDMLTAGLLHAGKFQVLQRSHMQELSRELELIQSALADRDRLPQTLPTRQGAYLFHGTIDEKANGATYTVIVQGQLVHAATGETVQDLRFEAPPQRLAAELSHFVDLIAARLAKPDASTVSPNNAARFDETAFLYQRAIRDLRRFRRLQPIDFSTRGFHVPGEPPEKNPSPPITALDAPLARYLLQKSIDRLESVRYIHPEHAAARYALGYCYSFHHEEIGRPELADSLLRAVALQDPEGPLAAAALQALAECSFHHANASVPRERRRTAAEQIASAFQMMPAAHRPPLWPRLPELLTRLNLSKDELQPVLDCMHAAAAFAEKDVAENRNPHQRAALARTAMRLASTLFRSESSASQAAAQTLLVRWSDSEFPELQRAAARTLGDLAAAEKNFREAARQYQRAAELSTHHIERNNLLWHAGRSLRLGGNPKAALALLSGINHRDARTSLNRGYVELEIGACHEDVNQPRKALSVYLAAAETIPGLVDNSNVVERIDRLGGAPLRDDRDFDLRWVDGPDGRTCNCRLLAADGNRLFCAGGDLMGIFAYDPRTGSWEHIGPSIRRAACLTVANGRLWVGTEDDGLWRCELSTGRWKQWTEADGLPDRRIASLLAEKDDLYAGVGTASGGGLIRLNDRGEVHVFDGPQSPRTAPTHLVAADDALFVRTAQGILRWQRGDGAWTPLEVRGNPGLFPGTSGIWASSPGAELFPFDPAGTIDEPYRAAWFPPGQGKAGYPVRFVIEEEDVVWFGGGPWQRFRSAGFYRVDKRTGAFTIYGPRDGFRTSVTWETYAGLQLAGRVWLATSAGLTELHPRQRRN